MTTHGFAVNVDNDLQPFEWVVPCGLPGVRMTSLRRGDGPARAASPCFRKRMALRLLQALGRRQRLVTPGRLGAGRPVPSLA